MKETWVPMVVDFRTKPRRLGLPQMSQAPHFNAWEPQLGGKSRRLVMFYKRFFSHSIHGTGICIPTFTYIYHIH